jgi:hypothetical protein
MTDLLIVLIEPTSDSYHLSKNKHYSMEHNNKVFKSVNIPIYELYLKKSDC